VASVMNLAVVIQTFAMWCNQSLLAAGTRAMISVDNMAHKFNNGKFPTQCDGSCKHRHAAQLTIVQA
jgi:hypothetical protein